MLEEEIYVTKERVRVLYGRAFSSFGAAFLAALLMSYLFKDQIAPPFLLGWLCFISVVTLLRMWMLFDYNKNQKDTLLHNKFENRYFFGTALVGIGWAVFIAAAFSLSNQEYQLYGLIILTAIIALAVPIFSCSMKSFYIFIAPLLIVATPMLLNRGGNNVSLAVALILFSMLVIRAARDSNRALIDTLSLRFKTQEMAERLDQLYRNKSEADKRVLLHRQHSPVGIIEWNLDFEVMDWNPAAEEIFGFSKEEALGRHSTDLLIPEKARQEVDAAWKGLLANQGGYHTINENLTKDGQTIYCEWFNTSLEDNDGNVIGVTSIVNDISERSNVEEVLHITQQRLMLHRAQSSVGVIEWNRNFEFVDWNPAAEAIFGFTKDEVIGAHITDRILPEGSRPIVEEVWNELLEQKGGTHSINENITKDGQTIWCEWHNTPLIDQDGHVIGVTSLVDDITERQKQEDDTRQTMKMDAIGNLTGGIAHDFNNMLSIILGFSNLLRDRLIKVDPKAVEFCDEVLNAGDRAKQLTAKLLAFSRTAPSAVEKININDVIHGMQTMLGRTLTPYIKVKLELEEDLWPVMLDKERLEDAILNMSINSMHAMPDGGVLTLSTSNKNLEMPLVDDLEVQYADYVVLSINDTGSGMTREVQQKMFDPFYTTNATEGTGLGLSQVYGYIQQSGGFIDVDSEPEQGTRIAISFPRFLQEEDIVTEKVVIEKPELKSGEGTILVVDDEPALLTLSEMILSEYGYTILCAESGEEALEVLENEHVDLMLSDVIMPGMGGYQLAAAVESLYPEVKIQMISGFIDDRNMDLASEKLHQNRLQKPVSPEDLVAQVEKLLNK